MGEHLEGIAEPVLRIARDESKPGQHHGLVVRDHLADIHAVRRIGAELRPGRGRATPTEVSPPNYTRPVCHLKGRQLH
jgi:hypothetical protein